LKRYIKIRFLKKGKIRLKKSGKKKTTLIPDATKVKLLVSKKWYSAEMWDTRVENADVLNTHGVVHLNGTPRRALPSDVPT